MIYSCEKRETSRRTTMKTSDTKYNGCFESLVIVSIRSKPTQGNYENAKAIEVFAQLLVCFAS